MRRFRVTMVLREITRAVVEVNVSDNMDTEAIKDLAWGRFDEQVREDEEAWGKKLEQENGTTLKEI
jgi:hypothetical protein